MRSLLRFLESQTFTPITKRFFAPVNVGWMVSIGTYSQAVFCPDWYPPDPPIYARPMIAVGLLMHHDGDAFTGVQLVCRGVKSGSTTTLSEDSIGY